MALRSSGAAPSAETVVVAGEYSCVGDAEKLACTEDVQPAEKA